MSDERSTEAVATTASDDGVSCRAWLANNYARLRSHARRIRRFGACSPQTTSLAHAAAVRMIAHADTHTIRGDEHMVAVAVAAVRTAAVDRCRRRLAQRRDERRCEALTDELAAEALEVVRIHEALEELAALEPNAAQVVHLRFFGGLTLDEAAAELGVSPRSADRLWAFARAWLARSLEV